MVEIKVNADSYVEQISDPSGDDWDRGETSTDHYINDFEVVKKDQYSNLVVNFDPKPGVPYYLLYAVYSTGDSFGWDNGRCIEFIELYQCKDKAEENKEKIQKKSNMKCDDYNVEIENETGEVYNFYIPWMGYFESLDYIRVEKICMK